MVSKLSILKTYYHLPLEDQFSFTYEDEHYYLTNKPFPLSKIHFFTSNQSL